MKKTLLFLTALFVFVTQNSEAHPHAFIDMKTKILAKDGLLRGFSVEWLLDEISSSEILYDLRAATGDPQAGQALADDIMKNVVSEHYFSYLYDKRGNKIKYSAKPLNYGLKAIGSRVLYYFDFMLARPQSLADNEFVLEIYDPTYYVSMSYADKSAVDFSAVLTTCEGDMIDPKVDAETREYASSLDKSQREADYSLGAVFAQKVTVRCK